MAGEVPGSSASAQAQSITQDDYVRYSRQYCNILMTCRDDGFVLDSKFNFVEDICFIYAETVYIADPIISLPGKSLRIFCNNLVLQCPKVCIDVSGMKGDKGASGGDQANGKKGGDGGDFYLYVENATTDLGDASSLRIKANGGDGGIGYDQQVAGTTSAKGGNGGDGGNAGSIRVWFNHPAMRILSAFHQHETDKSWSDLAQVCAKSIIPPCKALHGPTPKDDSFTLALQTMEEYVVFGDVAAAVQSPLRIIAMGGDPSDPTAPVPGPQTISAAKKLCSSLKTLLSGAQAPTHLTSVPKPNPPVDQKGKTEQSELLQFVQKTVEIWLSTGGYQAEKELVQKLTEASEKIDALTTPNGGDISDWETAISTVKGVLIELLDQMQDSLKNKASEVLIGQGGRGGMSDTAATPDGVHGKNGSLKPEIAAIEVKVLGLDGRLGDIDVDHVLAFPDQCQMVLEKADSYYFANNSDLYKDAAVLYNRLVKRLAFLGNIDSDEYQVKLRSSRLGKAYSYMQDVFGLTAAPWTQLQTIYNRSTMNLARLLSGKDMFGGLRNFAPRMSYRFYEAGVEKSIKNLAEFEKVCDEYMNAMKDQSKFEAAITEAQNTNQVALAAVTDQINMLASENGFLSASIRIIADKTPQLKTAKDSLCESLKSVEWTLKKHHNVSPGQAIEMLASIAMAPHGFNSVVQIAGMINKEWTTIEDNQGNAVQKEYVVYQFESCGGTLESLQEAHKTRSDGQIQVDDPGAMKVLATADSIRQLLIQFKDSIPKDQSDALSKDIDSYVDIITQRNTAVLDYNSGLQQLVELVKNKKIYERHAKEIGSSMLDLKPDLPAIYFWLKRMRAGRRLETMRLLNYAGRAVAFWEPLDFSTFSFSEPGPLKDSTSLENQHSSLLASFDKSVELMSSSVWIQWPTDDQQKGQGVLVRLSDEETAALKKPRVDSSGQTSYDVIVDVRSESIPAFHRMANIRISQVRVWLLGADVDLQNRRKIVTVHIQQLGEESIRSSITGKVISFSHVPISLRFSYDMTTEIKDVSQCNGKIATTWQDMKSYFGGPVDASSAAPIGPFGKWRITLWSDENKGLQMDLKEVYLEFCGRGLSIET